VGYLGSIHKGIRTPEVMLCLEHKRSLQTERKKKKRRYGRTPNRRGRGLEIYATCYNHVHCRHGMDDEETYLN